MRKLCVMEWHNAGKSEESRKSLKDGLLRDRDNFHSHHDGSHTYFMHVFRAQCANCGVKRI